MTANSITGYELDGGGTLSGSLLSQLKLLIATPVGTVVFDRDFGIDRSALDMPGPIAQTTLAAELADKVERYIPELRLSAVEAAGHSLDGALHLKVVVELAESV